MDEAGVFNKIPRIDDSRPAEIFARDVMSFLIGRELLSSERAERILPCRSRSNDSIARRATLAILLMRQLLSGEVTLHLLE